MFPFKFGRKYKSGSSHNPPRDKPEGPLHAYETSNPEQTLNHKGMRRVGVLRTY